MPSPSKPNLPLLQFSLCIAASKQLKSFHSQCWELPPAHPASPTSCDATRTAEEVASSKAALLQAKKLASDRMSPSAMAALTFCIVCRVQLRSLYTYLHALQLQPVNMEQAWCKERLHALQQFGSWSDLGFQGKDPCTDFRGSGRLGLASLHSMCLSMPDTMLQLLRECRDHHTAYPFACAVINVVHRCITALKRGQLDAAMRCGSYHEHAFHAVVACAVCRCAAATSLHAIPHFSCAGCTFCGEAARFLFFHIFRVSVGATDFSSRSPPASWSSRSTWTGSSQRLFFAVSC